MQFMQVFKREAAEDVDVVTGMVGAGIAGSTPTKDALTVLDCDRPLRYYIRFPVDVHR